MPGAETSQKCAWCGNEIPPRSDPRGCKARYCCSACRTSAARERTRKAHQDGLKQAQAQAQASDQNPLLVASPAATPQTSQAEDTVEVLVVASRLTLREEPPIAYGVSP